MGPLSERAAMGHCPRGLQHRRQRLGLFHPRPGAIARLSLGRGRTRRDLRRPSVPVLRAGTLERQGSDSQGTDIRPDEQRSEPRRGRQGVLLLSRFDADALVHEIPVQVSAGVLSLRQARRDEQETHPERFRIRAARYGHLRRRPLLRCLRGIREGGSRRHPRPDHGLQSRS